MNNNRSTNEHEVASMEIIERRLSLTGRGDVDLFRHVVDIDLFNAEGERVNRLTLFGVDGDKIKIKIKRNKTRHTPPGRSVWKNRVEVAPRLQFEQGEDI
jgi:hypothetical protein